jgi:hypothetical protein
MPRLRAESANSLEALIFGIYSRSPQAETIHPRATWGTYPTQRNRTSRDKKKRAANDLRSAEGRTIYSREATARLAETHGTQPQPGVKTSLRKAEEVSWAPRPYVGMPMTVAEPSFCTSPCEYPELMPTQALSPSRLSDSSYRSENDILWDELFGYDEERMKTEADAMFLKYIDRGSYSECGWGN